MLASMLLERTELLVRGEGSGATTKAGLKLPPVGADADVAATQKSATDRNVKAFIILLTSGSSIYAAFVLF